MEAIGRRWYCDSFNVGLPGPTAPVFQAVGYCDRKEPDCCQDLWSQPSSSEMDDLHSFIISSLFFGLEFTVGVHGQVGVHG